MFLARTIALTFAAIATVPFFMPSPAIAEVTFYLQREGSPEDTGLADFIADLGTFEEQDFEDPALGELGDEVPQLFFEDGMLEVETMGLWAERKPAKLGASTEFDAEGRFYGRALVAGINLTATAQDGRAITGLGMWIFDDTSAYDAVYLIQVTETDGVASETILENEIGMNPHGHEIEGFFGAISDIGIVSVSITPVDPETHESLPDLFQTDHWMIAGMPVVEPEPEPEPPTDIDPNVDPDPDTDTDSNVKWHHRWRWRHRNSDNWPNADKLREKMKERHEQWAEKIKERKAKRQKRYNDRRRGYRRW